MFGKNVIWLKLYRKEQLCRNSVTISFFGAWLRLRTFLFNGRCNNKFNIVIKEGKSIPDYKQMYLTLLDSVETAIEMLKNVEQACEDIYIDTDKTNE